MITLPFIFIYGVFDVYNICEAETVSCLGSMNSAKLLLVDVFINIYSEFKSHPGPSAGLWTMWILETRPHYVSLAGLEATGLLPDQVY